MILNLEKGSLSTSDQSANVALFKNVQVGDILEWLESGVPSDSVEVKTSKFYLRKA